MYKGFAETARKEGFPSIADMFERVAVVEMQHEKIYRSYIEKLDNGEMFKGNGAETKWICLNCGYIHTGAEPPKSVRYAHILKAILKNINRKTFIKKKKVKRTGYKYHVLFIF